MVSKEVCSWPGESAWPHLTGGADGGGQNVWVQGSSCWTWSSPASPRVGTSLSGCWMAAPPCERDRSQQSAWPILSANLKRSQNHQHHEKKHWFQIRIDFYVLNRYRKRISYCLYHRKLGQFPVMRGLHLSPLWVGTFRQKKETHIVIWAKFFKLYQLFEIMGRQSWQKVFLCFYQIQFC